MNYKEKVIALLNSQEPSKEQKEKLESIFPELAESEDERIRKSLIILLQHFCKGYRVPGLDFPISYKDMLAWVEKQCEQNPAWNEKDKEMFDYTLDMIEWYDGKNKKRVSLVNDWLKSLKDRVQPQPKQEWSEEDDKIIEKIINDIECARAINYHAPKESYEFRENWLKSLKNRYTWKPSGEQMDEFSGLLDEIHWDGDILVSLYNDLKKLRG